MARLRTDARASPNQSLLYHPPADALTTQEHGQQRKSTTAFLIDSIMRASRTFKLRW